MATPTKRPIPVRALRTQASTQGKGEVTSVQTARILERRYQVMEMRKNGLPIHVIASTLGCGMDTVRNDIRDVLGQTATALFETTEEARNLERVRYEALLAKYQPMAEKGDKAAAMIVLQVSKELRKMEAIDKPEEKKTEETGVRVYVGIDIDGV